VVFPFSEGYELLKVCCTGIIGDLFLKFGIKEEIVDSQMIIKNKYLTKICLDHCRYVKKPDNAQFGFFLIKF